MSSYSSGKAVEGAAIITLDVSMLKAGVYFLRLDTRYEREVRKVVIE